MQDRETMETVIIILISVLIALTIGLIVIVLLRSKDQKGNIGKQDLQVTTDQLDKSKCWKNYKKIMPINLKR